jgi:hypothetical protein
MVHCGDALPYLSPAHPKKGDDSDQGSQDCDALGIHTWRCRNLTIQLQDMPKDKVMCEHVWCTTCHLEGNQRDECMVLPNYATTGKMTPFPYG